MHDETQPPNPGGSVPHAYGNALARRWAPELPRQLTGGFLTLLYALRALASADGRLRYERDGHAITISQIAKACRSDQKDVRVYLNAAIAAGVVGVVEDTKGRGQTRGRATMYALLVSPSPNWEAARGIVWIAQQEKAEKRAARATRKTDTAPAAPTTSGDSAPNPNPQPGSGDSPPNVAGASSGDSAPSEFGGQSPSEFGGQCPDHPGLSHELPHEMADVGPQAEAARETPPAADEPTGSAWPPLREVPTPRGGRRPADGSAKGSSSQRPLLLPVRGLPADRRELSPEQRDAVRAQATPELVRHAIATEGMGQAVALYGIQLVAQATNDIPATDTGT